MVKRSSQTKEGSKFIQKMLSFLGRSEMREDRRRIDERDNDKEPVKLFNDNESEMLFNTRDAEKLNKVLSEKIGTLKQLLTPTSDAIEAQMSQNAMMIQLTPEILQAKRIFVSSILSPNDLQTGQVAIQVDTDGEFDSGVDSRLSEELTNFFNRRFGIGAKLSKWIGECLFDAGCHPVMVLPRNVTDSITVDKHAMTSLESLSATVGQQTSLDLVDDVDLIASLETIPGIGSVKNFDKPESGFIDDAKKAAKLLMKNFGTMDGGNSLLTVSFNPGDIKNGGRANLDKAKALNDTYIKSSYGNLFMVGDDPKMTSEDRPIVVNLPPSSVIPITLPGSPDEHVGYFVLVDKLGTPIKCDTPNVTPESMGLSAALDKSYNAMAIKAETPFKSAWSNLNGSMRWKAMSTVMELSIRKMLTHYMGKAGVDSVDIGTTNMISNIVVYNMLKKNNCKFVFVPESLMCYYCFDYREDGTGKSLLEDVKGTLALRTTLLVTLIMSAIDNATLHTRVEVNIDEKETNVEQLLQLVENLWIGKKRLDMTNLNPVDISSRVAKNSLEIVPKGIPGLEDALEVTRTAESGQSGDFDDEILERLTHMILTGLGIPYAAVNETDEAEYARSVATVNLVFSNVIRMLQMSLQPTNDKFIRKYSILSSDVRNIIERVITGAAKVGDEDSKTKHSASADNDIRIVIQNMSMILPAPNVSVTNTQFENIDTFMGTLGSVLEQLFPEELLMTDDSAMKEKLLAVRSFLGADVLRKYITAQSNTALDIPTLEEFMDEHSTTVGDTHQMLVNFFRKIDDLMKVTKPSDESGGGGRGW
jgi:hypothetical protein